MFPPPTETEVINGELVKTADTEMLPSTARLLTQPTPEPPPVIVRAFPFWTCLLKILNVSPAVNVGPRFDTVTVPVPLLVKVPLTEVTSFEGFTLLFTS